MKVYWGITASRSYKRTIPASESVLLSAAGLWNGARFRRKGLSWQDWVLDSGGFIALNKWGDFPYTPDQYLQLVHEMAPSWAASMDYPCEPDMAKGAILSVSDRIDATVEKAAYLMARSDLIVPVLQGYTIDEYAACWDLLCSRVKVRRLAIGSVCRRQATSDIAALAWNLRELLPRNLPVHGFGVKLLALRQPEVWALFTSIDTNAWEFRARGLKQRGVWISDSQAWLSYQAMVQAISARPRQLVL